MTSKEAFRFINGRRLELSYQIKLSSSEEEIRRIKEEQKFLIYAAELCARAEVLNIRRWESLFAVRAFDGGKKERVFSCYHCPRCGKWVLDKEGLHFCEWCGQALDFSGNGKGR